MMTWFGSLNHLDADVPKNERHASRPTLVARGRIGQHAGERYVPVLLYHISRLGFQDRIGVIADQLVVVAAAVPSGPVCHRAGTRQRQFDIGPAKVSPYTGEVRNGRPPLGLALPAGPAPCSATCPQAGNAAAAANATHKRKSRRCTLMISSRLRFGAQPCSDNLYQVPGRRTTRDELKRTGTGL